MKGRLVILSGPSGVGKDTLIDSWSKVNPLVMRVVAYTTRQPRPGEKAGLDYHFVTQNDFEELAKSGHFLEYKSVFGNYYATPLKDMEAMLAEGKVAILKIDVQGALTVMDLRPDAISVFIMPPSTEELERRIVGRGTDEQGVIQRRLEHARSEIALANRYQHRVVNDSVESAVVQLEKIVDER